jgi:hypothetical protein
MSFDRIFPIFTMRREAFEFLPVAASSYEPDAEALKAAFIEHKENPGLWGDPGLFRRIKK